MWISKGRNDRFGDLFWGPLPPTDPTDPPLFRPDRARRGGSVEVKYPDEYKRIGTEPDLRQLTADNFDRPEKQPSN